jgi:2,4-dienoyl-CoA reductase-like NADH-dependent reductase (Old Yellow Enzyme family)
MASVLFSPITMRGLTLPNRVVVSPMCQYASNDGSATDWHLQHLGSFSLGAAGLVMTEMTMVSRIGRISHKCAGLYSDDNEKALKRVIDFCKTFGIAKQGIQIGHAGRKGSTLPPAQGGKPLKPEEDAWETLGPSPIPFGEGWHIPREMTKADLKQVLDEFVSSVERADRVGYDLVEIHGGHGYLLTSSFRRSPTSAATNMAARSKSACAIRWRCSRPAARSGRRTSRWASASRRWTGSRAAPRSRTPSLSPRN